MPYPGKKVCTCRDFDGKLKDIDDDFKCKIKEFVESIFGQQLTVKQVNGRDINTQELLQYFKAYFEVFNIDEMPEPKSIFEANAKADHLTAKDIAMEHYMHAMDQVTGFSD